MDRMNICVRDLGRIGLPTAAMIALGGHNVVGYDADASVLHSLEDGARGIADEGVRALVAEGQTAIAGETILADLNDRDCRCTFRVT